MSTTDGYFKSARSSASDNCVEVRFLPDGWVSVRHSRHPNRLKLEYRRQAWNALLRAVGPTQFPTGTEWQHPGADLLSDVLARRTAEGQIELALRSNPYQALTFTAGEWQAFCEGARDGEFSWQPPAETTASVAA